MNIERLDHLVLTVRDVEATCSFYHRLLGMEIVEFGGGRKALVFGSQKINLHPHGSEFKPHAGQPTPGSADICFVTSTPLGQFLSHCREHGVDILEGPVQRTGAGGPILSVYLRDPDRNLLEIANVLPASPAEEKDMGISGISDAW